MNSTILALSLSLGLLSAPAEGKVEPLWPAGVPGGGAAGKEPPSLTIYLPPADRATGTAVVVCPGGGYGHLAVGHEGKDVAEWLNKRGVAAFVLRYRIATREHPGPLHPGPLQDAQRALRTVRARAKEWEVHPQRIGIWGFSAGGHLASTAATHFDAGKPESADRIERVSCRPDFAILAYPVISLKPPFVHKGSRQNLLGKNPTPEQIESLSNETQVTPKTPPTFLFHTGTDRGVLSENSVLFYLALHKAGVPAELHIFEKGPHGVGLAPKDPILSTWPELLAAWMKGRGLFDRSAGKDAPR